MTSRTDRAFAPPSSNYRKALSGIDWRAEGIDDALLLMPKGGSTRTSPASIGDALNALRDRTFSAYWRSSFGLALDPLVSAEQRRERRE